MPIPKAASVLAPIALVLAAGCAPAATTEGAPAAGAGAAAAVAVTPEMITAGRQLFTGAGRCGVCHGPQGRGSTLGPDLTDDEWIWVEPGATMHAQVVTIIRTGIEEPRESPAPMPAMGGGNLTEDQLNALAAYVGSL
jgi:mono/diheme cytochrome c family protein